MHACMHGQPALSEAGVDVGCGRPQPMGQATREQHGVSVPMRGHAWMAGPPRFRDLLYCWRVHALPLTSTAQRMMWVPRRYTAARMTGVLAEAALLGLAAFPGSCLPKATEEVLPPRAGAPRMCSSVRGLHPCTAWEDHSEQESGPEHRAGAQRGAAGGPNCPPSPCSPGASPPRNERAMSRMDCNPCQCGNQATSCEAVDVGVPSSPALGRGRGHHHRLLPHGRPNRHGMLRYCMAAIPYGGAHGRALSRQREGHHGAQTQS
jgi:hypothetical protein